MEEGARKTKGPKRPGKSAIPRSHEMYERRPLKTTNLVPPKYDINPATLLDSCVEKEIKFAGVIHNIPLELDTTNRTDVLRVIDRGKREENIPWRLTRENDAIFCLTVHNIKISRWDGKEELLLRVPIHEIAAICYIRDDAQHILALKYGDRDEVPDMCQLAVFHSDSQTSSQELCALIDQCFQLVYAEATRQFFDTKLSEAVHNMTSISSSSATRSGSSSSSSGTSPPRHPLPDLFAVEEKDYDSDRQYHSNLSTPRAQRPQLTFFSGSRYDLDQQGGTISTSNESRSLPPSRRRSSATPSESELSAAAAEQLQDYMKTLHNKLDPDELRRFAMLLREWGANQMPVTEFCDKVFELYGNSRKHLLVGMRPFIPDSDYTSFETFLDKIGLGAQSNWGEAHASHNSMRFRRTHSGTSTLSNQTQPYMGDEYDRMLNDISADIENLETSVSMNTDPESFLPKST